MKLVRVLVLVILGGFGAWLGRLLAHSKLPLPEGQWREVPPEEFRSQR
ncbi:MAG: hypothetical protein KY391_04210 [Actinobacteria bacterium]|nr:hypothetical protein [Actinomycetota bacterium]